MLPGLLFQQQWCSIWKQEPNLANIPRLAQKLPLTLQFCNRFCCFFCLVTPEWLEGSNTICTKHRQLLHKITKSKSQVLANEPETEKSKRQEYCGGLGFLFFNYSNNFLFFILVINPLTPVSGEKALLCSFHTSCRLQEASPYPSEYRLGGALYWHISPCHWVKLGIGVLLQMMVVLSRIERRIL